MLVVTALMYNKRKVLQNICEVRELSGAVKKSGSEVTPKRPRNETPSPMPAFKVIINTFLQEVTFLIFIL